MTERLGALVGSFLACACWFAGFTPLAAAAEFEIVPGSFVARVLDADGDPENRAGAHPDRLQVDFALNVDETSVRDLVFDLPPGLGGSANAVPECPREPHEQGQECPPESQVGILKAVLSGGAEVNLPIFQLEARPGELLSFGSQPAAGLSLALELRPEDLGVRFNARDLPPGAMREGHVELWGIPADHQVGTAIPRRTFLTLPSRCGPMAFAFQARSWEEDAQPVTASAATSPLESCEDLAFEPRLAMELDAPLADSPTGMQIDLSLLGEDDADGRAEAQIENATIRLPDGVAVSPAGAEGLVACSDDQVGLGNAEEARCPPASKVGTAEFASPALGGAIAGAVYLGEERPGERFRLLVAAPAAGTTIKFVAALSVDASGQISTALRGLPQVPVQRIGLGFDGGPRALLASPLACGPASASAAVEPYGGGPVVEPVATVSVEPRTPGAPCLGVVPFAPELRFASSTNRAGRPSSISATILRKDGEQLPRRFELSFAKGLSAALGSIQPCAEADVTLGACPPQSQVGSALALVGSGPQPATLRGGVFVTGPYRRSPFGMAMQFRAAIGPFDLGTITIRSAIRIDGRSGRVTLASDSLPSSIEGVSIRFRAIAIQLDRQGLVRNPTSCRPGGVDGVLESSTGASAVVGTPFTVTRCRGLGFRPRLRIELGAGGGADGSSLRVRARLRRGDSNLRTMKIFFPPALKLNTAAAKEICSRPDAALGTCPDGSRIGTVTARTSLLDERLKGGVYVVQPAADGLPDLGLALHGGGLRVQFQGRTGNHEGHFVTKLVGLPDLAITTLNMKLGGAGAAVFSLEGSPCAGGPAAFAAAVLARAQNGARRSLRVPIESGTRCRR